MGKKNDHHVQLAEQRLSHSHSSLLFDDGYRVHGRSEVVGGGKVLNSRNPH